MKSFRRSIATAGLSAAMALAGELAAGPAIADPVTEPAKRKSGIKLTVRPGDVEVHLNGKKLGVAKDVGFVPTKPGKHALRLVRGGDELEVELVVSKGQVVEFAYDFE